MERGQKEREGRKRKEGRKEERGKERRKKRRDGKREEEKEEKKQKEKEIREGKREGKGGPARGRQEREGNVGGDFFFFNKTFRSSYMSSLQRNRDKKCHLLSTQTGLSLRFGTNNKEGLAKRKVWTGVQDPATINLSPNPNLA